MINKLLIANRGEVAVRIIAACRKLGIASVAIYAHPDKACPHVLAADEAIALNGDSLAETYLDQQQIIAAALQNGATAIHPGFGFLSENADFARSCRQAGLVFIGPSVEAMAALASKSSAKALVSGLGLPVIPGVAPQEQSPQALAAAASEMGYPVLLKAAAGGGGMGMRVVESQDNFLEALDSARLESRSAFDDDFMLVERYFPSVRHIEVQLIADSHGNYLHAYERECSIQRRRQKVVEEAPAPTLGESLRQQMTEAAVAIARAVDYVGLGTVEFIVDEQGGEFYFLEMNTRLQVEHGITEQVTGLDLVAMQIEIAEGRVLKWSQDEIQISGHAIECRLYAEDPEEDFAPATGRVLKWRPLACESLRIDSAIEEGSVITPFYDPMVAKLITWGADRPRAIRSMQQALTQSCLLGVTSNQGLLAAILSHSAFGKARVDTGFIDHYLEDLLPGQKAAMPDAVLAAAALTVAESQLEDCAPGLRFERDYHFFRSDEEFRLRVVRSQSGDFDINVGDRALVLEIGPTRGDGARWLSVEGCGRWFHVAREAQSVFIHAVGVGQFTLRQVSRFARTSVADGQGDYCSDMPGRIVAVMVEPGVEVKAGDKLLTMESMKMEHSKVALTDGVVSRLFVAEGDVVEKNAQLIDIEQVAS